MTLKNKEAQQLVELLRSAVGSSSDITAPYMARHLREDDTVSSIMHHIIEHNFELGAGRGHRLKTKGMTSCKCSCEG